jgi:hypothetical protein
LLDRLWLAVSAVQFGDMAGSVTEDARSRAQVIAPVVWLLGKTGAGKTAIVAALTGDPRATVGEGFEPCTRTAAFYDVPPEVPLLRFLDTRGLEEPDYDPAKDIAKCETQSHLLLVVMQVSDPVQHTVMRVLREARRRHPDWPVVVAQTGLHRLYPVGKGHPTPYPYTGGSDDERHPALPHGLRQALAHQRRLFEGLPGPPPRFVPIDFTVPEDGFPPHDFGLEMFWCALQEAGPNPTCADWVVRPRQINGLGEKSPLHFFWEVGSGAACEARQLAFGEAHSFGQDDAETIKECGLSRIGLGDATQADLAVGCGR